MTEDEASVACSEILTRCTAEARAIVIAQMLASFLILDVEPKSIKAVGLNIAKASVELALRLAKELRRVRQPPTAHRNRRD